jgi:hypothetical protein
MKILRVRPPTFFMVGHGSTYKPPPFLHNPALAETTSLSFAMLLSASPQLPGLSPMRDEARLFLFENITLDGRDES